MPRIRTLKPEALQHRKVGQLSDRAFRLWILLITQADDEGRMICDIAQFRVLGWGYHPKVTLTHIETALHEVATWGLIRLYSVNGTQYVDIPSWQDHQLVRHTSYYRPSKLPSIHHPQSHSARIADNSAKIADHSASIPPLKELKGTELKGTELKGSPLLEPPPQGRPSDFETFWAEYGKKEGKGKAEEAWKKHTRSVSLDTILAGLVKWRKSQKWADGFIPMPATWLNQRRWEDDPIPASPFSSTAEQARQSATRLLTRSRTTSEDPHD